MFFYLVVFGGQTMKLHAFTLNGGIFSQIFRNP